MLRDAPDKAYISEKEMAFSKAVATTVPYTSTTGIFYSIYGVQINDDNLLHGTAGKWQGSKVCYNAWVPAGGIVRPNKVFNLIINYIDKLIKMKRQLLTIVAIAGTLAANAQTAVVDTVSLGAGSANQVWYSLDKDEKGTQALNNWDLAFDTKGITSGIRINSAAGVMLWNYPKGDKSAWGSVDTNGLSTWSARYDSDTSWTYCAMGRYADPNDPFDLDWGKYNLTTHEVLGDSLYIIKLVDGSYKKLIIESLKSGKYNIKYADLSGSNEKTASIDKTGFNAADFGYFSIVDNKTLQREPSQGEWDLVFTKYTGFVPIAYGVTGVLHSRGATAVKAVNIADVNAYKNYSAHTMTHEINTLGYNWKTYNGSGYDIADSTVYFVQTVNGEVFKVVFTGYISADASIIFSKTKLANLNIRNVANKVTATVALAPNPALGQNVTVVYSFKQQESQATISVYDMMGKLVILDELNTNKGLHQYVITKDKLAAGTYVVSVNTANGRATQKLIVK